MRPHQILFIVILRTKNLVPSRVKHGSVGEDIELPVRPGHTVHRPRTQVREINIRKPKLVHVCFRNNDVVDKLRAVIVRQP